MLPNVSDLSFRKHLVRSSVLSPWRVPCQNNGMIHVKNSCASGLTPFRGFLFSGFLPESMVTSKRRLRPIQPNLLRFSAERIVNETWAHMMICQATGFFVLAELAVRKVSTWMWLTMRCGTQSTQFRIVTKQLAHISVESIYILCAIAHTPPITNLATPQFHGRVFEYFHFYYGFALHKVVSRRSYGVRYRHFICVQLTLQLCRA